ncbi:sortase domain-bontaining protein [Mycetocola sp.]|uniref:sortase n=1 Tax=Mycetocola sp. TaxID=1871042 RepID=UPI003989FD6E
MTVIDRPAGDDPTEDLLPPPSRRSVRETTDGSSRPPRVPKAPKLPRVPKPPRGEGPPTPPRRMPAPARVPVSLTPRKQVIRGALTVIAALLLTFVLNVTVIGHIQHLVAQQQLGDQFRLQLEESTAPVSEGDVYDVLLPDGAPVALLTIPRLGIKEIIVEGTDADSLQAGPGHRRDTMLPGQAGVSVIMGRAAAFGGPFARIQELAPGDKFSIVTGQGKHSYEVIGLRYAGDLAPPALKAGESRVILTTARGTPYSPSGVARVDARLVSDVQPAGPRLTNFVTLPPQDRELQGDTSTVWALVFALQFLLLVEIGAVWAYRRIGARQTWIVFVPVVILSSLLVTEQVVRLLPNLL